MKRKFVLGFTGILLFISNVIYSQSDTLKGKFTLQFHINWVGDFYQNVFVHNYDRIDSDVTKKHFFVYNDSYDGPGYLGSVQLDSTTLSQREWYQFYSFGIALIKEKNLTENFNLFYRLKINRGYYQYVYKRQVETITYAFNEVLSEYKIYTLKSFQITPAAGITGNKWFLKYYLGIEIPFYLRGDGKEIHECYTYSNGILSSSFSNFEYEPGGYFIGLSLFGNISAVMFKKFSIGLEGAAGPVYYHPFYRSYKFTDEKDIRFIVLYPSLTLSYKF
ncbi:MAG: hypothetical protein ABII90_08150 [Bacteroidota bacterium]